MIRMRFELSAKKQGVQYQVIEQEMQKSRWKQKRYGRSNVYPKSKHAVIYITTTGISQKGTQIIGTDKSAHHLQAGLSKPGPIEPAAGPRPDPEQGPAVPIPGRTCGRHRARWDPVYATLLTY